MTSSKRALTALATGALALPFITAPAAFAVAPDPGTTAQSVADLCANVPDDFEQFTDIDGNTFEDEIECIAYAGIALGNPRGIGTDKYGPSFTVNRDAMASFIARMIDAADNLDTGDNITALPSSDENNFTDVAASNPHAANINRLADAGIALGGPGGAPATTYGPQQQVTRAQMASFINRGIAYALGEDPADAGRGAGYSTTDDFFTDDEAFSANHEPNINGLASELIVIGDGVDTYRPTAFIQRDQMAGFIARALATLEEDGLIDPVTEDAANEEPVEPNPNEVNEITAVGTAGDVTIANVRANPDNTEADNRSFTVAGLDEGVEYRITLVKCENVSQDAAGNTVFVEDGTTGLAATGNPTADIITVEGAPATNNTGDGTADTTPVTNSAVGTPGTDGVLNFTIDGDTAECVVPVVYYNGGGAAGGEGGDSPRLELNDDGTPSEEFGVGPETTFTAAPPAVSTTEAPDLTNVEFVRTTDNNGDISSTYRFTFDEAIVGNQQNGFALPAGFALYAFDGTEFRGDTVLRDPNDPNSVLVVFEDATGDNFDSEALADLTLGAVDEFSVFDADGIGNPIGDDELGSGVARGAGVTIAPDVQTVTNARPFTGPGQTTPSATLVDFTFDENAFVVDEGGFQIVFTDNDVANCVAADNTTTTTDVNDSQGDGTLTITVSCPTTETGGAVFTLTEVARGVVEEGAVGDSDPVSATNVPDATDPGGNLNALQASETPDGDTTGADLVSVTFDPQANEATFTFDQPVTLNDTTGAFFGVYDRNGAPTEPGILAEQEATADTTIVVTFNDGVLDQAVGGSVDPNAVNGTVRGGVEGNQADEEGANGLTAFAAGSTTGPDLTSVSADANVTTNPATGVAETDEIEFTFTFDEALDDAQGNPNSGDFFAVLGAIDESNNAPAGADFRVQREFDACFLGDNDSRTTDSATTITAEDFVVTCIIDAGDADDDDALLENVVGGSVADDAVIDDDGESNPLGFEPLS